MIHPIWIPGWRPTPLNELLGNHHKAGRLKAHDRDVVGKACLAHAAGECVTKRRVDLRIILPKGQRGFDKDAFWKSALDALVASGALKNDSPAWCVPGDVKYSRAMDDEHGTLILLEDLWA